MITLGNGFPQISDKFIIYSNKPIADLLEDDIFLHEVDEQLFDMSYEYADNEENPEDLLDELGIDDITEWKDEYEEYNLPILYDERNE
jgi:hypothetical protein